ncbi:MAG: hypothetical protein OXE50_08085 [Chloroflexi bacterium]|nr:hypothetical protein [Chloroflexota bacterium]
MGFFLAGGSLVKAALIGSSLLVVALLLSGLYMAVKSVGALEAENERWAATMERAKDDIAHAESENERLAAMAAERNAEGEAFRGQVEALAHEGERGGGKGDCLLPLSLRSE